MMRQSTACCVPKGAGLERVGCAESGSDAGTREMAIDYRTRLIDYPTSDSLTALMHLAIIIASTHDQMGS